MKNILALFLIITASKYCAAQINNTNGLYIFYSVQAWESGMSGFKKVELLRLNGDNSFTYYRNSESDYFSEGVAIGKFKKSNDTLLLISQYPTSSNVRALPFCDTLGKEVIRLTFYSKQRLDADVTRNEYYSIDDSLNVMKLRPISTLPSQKALFEDTINESRDDHIRNLIKNNYQVLLKKNRPNIISIKALSQAFGVYTVNLNENFNKTNDFMIEVNPMPDRASGVFDDVTGMRFVNKGSGLKLVSDITGTPHYERHLKKLNPDNLNYLKIDHSAFLERRIPTETIRLSESMQLNKRTHYGEINHDTAYFNNSKGGCKDEKLYLTNKKYNEVVNSFLSLDFLKLNQILQAGYGSSYHILFYFNNGAYEIFTSKPSVNYLNLLMDSLIIKR